MKTDWHDSDQREAAIAAKLASAEDRIKELEAQISLVGGLAHGVTVETRFEDEILLSHREASILSAVKELFASKGTWKGGEFRVAFVRAAMDGYCDACGRGGDSPCHCS